MTGPDAATTRPLERVRPSTQPATLGAYRLYERLGAGGQACVYRARRLDDPDAGDELVAPWTMHTHFSTGIRDQSLENAVDALRASNYRGCYSVEIATTRYSEPAIVIAKLRDADERRR